MGKKDGHAKAGVQKEGVNIGRRKRIPNEFDFGSPNFFGLPDLLVSIAPDGLQEVICCFARDKLSQLVRKILKMS